MPLFIYFLGASLFRFHCKSVMPNQNKSLLSPHTYSIFGRRIIHDSSSKIKNYGIVFEST